MRASGESPMKTAIVTCVTGNWLPWAAVTLLSCVENGKAADSDLYVFIQQASDQNRADLAAFCAHHKITIRMVDVDASKLTTAPLGKWGVGTIIRLVLDRVLPGDYDRVLYLDSDVLVLHPLRRLFAADLEGRTVGAVIDMGYLPYIRKRAWGRKHALGFETPGNYFNAGVILFDWKKTLEERLLPRTIDMLNSGRKLGSPDQDALNLLLKDRWKKLDYRWNVVDIGRVYVRLEPFIVHFTGRKPWSDMRRTWDAPYHAYYRARLAGTPFAGAVATRRSPKLMIAETTAYFSWAARPRTRRLLRRFVTDTRFDG
jgi:lipopolysaccharide biosynthesis glycosyltransferase